MVNVFERIHGFSAVMVREKRHIGLRHTGRVDLHDGRANRCVSGYGCVDAFSNNAIEGGRG